ncbi:MAG: NlpC/P60 family protein [Clostridia bacterium]|nr:NlpC/P60 family protein [Clostridia bacterium]
MQKNLRNRVAVFLTAVFTMVSLMSPLVQAQASIVSRTPEEAKANYQKYMPGYQKREVPVINGFHNVYDGSLAHRVVARAIWYMEYGSIVYNHKKYPKTGQLDCSNFTQLVYNDFGFKITSAARNYGSVGTKVEGVSSKPDGNYRSTIVGLEKMKPGDVVAFWDPKYTRIGHVAVYMGIVNGHPMVIGTSDGRPTAIGIDNLHTSWMGKRLHSVRRILPADAWDPAASAKYPGSGPVIPQEYFLPPQTPVVMPDQLPHGF